MQKQISDLQRMLTEKTFECEQNKMQIYLQNKKIMDLENSIDS